MTAASAVVLGAGLTILGAALLDFTRRRRHGVGALH